LGEFAAQIGDQAIVDLQALYGYVLPYRPVLVFYNSPQAAAADLGNAQLDPLGSAVIGRAYFGTSAMIALADLDWAVLAQVIRHEITHLYQFQMGALLFEAPLWWVEGDAKAQEPADSQAKTLLAVQTYAAQRQLPYLPTWNFDPQRGDDLQLHMEMGASFILFLREKYGDAAHAQFYAQWRASEDFYAAFETGYGVSLAHLDWAWRAWVAGWG
jgi:hypothetical protein